MPTVKQQAICIRHWDWSETSQTVSLFTEGHGVVRGLAKGSRREHAPFSGGLELLTRGEVVLILKGTAREGGSLSTLTAWDLQEPYSGLRRSLKALHAGMFLADLVHHALRELDPHPPLFGSMTGGLETLDRGQSPGRVVMGFLWDVLVETGYRPEVFVDAQSGGPLAESAVYLFSPAMGGLVGSGEVREPGAVPGTGGELRRRGGPGSRSGSAGSGAGETWKVRSDTVGVLRKLAGAGETVDYGALVADTSLSDDAVVRSSLLLATYFRSIHQVLPPSIRWVLPGLSHSGGSGAG